MSKKSRACIGFVCSLNAFDHSSVMVVMFV